MTITGSGFGPSDTVTCQVLQLNCVFDNQTSPAHQPWTVTADTNGNFTTTWTVPADQDELGSTLQLTASGNPSGLTASATFADGNLSCSSPANGTAPVLVPTGGFGIYGNLLANSAPDPAGVGNWLPGSAGAGGNVLDANGCPLDATTTFHLFNSGDAFAGGDKADDNPNTWTWAAGSVLTKDTLGDVLIHVSKAAYGHTWIMAAATRESGIGESYVDFEFLQNTLTQNADGTFTSAGPNGGRTVNDFVLALTLTGGGSVPGLCVLSWQPVSGGFDYIDETTSIPTGAVFGAVNLASVSIPNCPSGSLNTYSATTEFGEVAVDLTALIGSINSCATTPIVTILVKTKTSQSTTASIEDFIAPLAITPALVIGPSASAGPAQTLCSQGATTTFNLTGTAQAGTSPITGLAWTVDSMSSGATVTFDPSTPTTCGANCTSLPVTAHVGGTLPATVTLRLTVTTMNNCGSASETSTVVLTVNPLPDCTISGSDAVYAGSTGNLFNGPTGTGLTYAWSFSTPLAGVTFSAGSVQTAQSVTVDVDPSLLSGSFTLQLTVTDANGCSSTCNKSVEINPSPSGCIISLNPAVCSGATQLSYSVDPGSQGVSYDWSFSANTTPPAVFSPTPSTSDTSVDVNTAGLGTYTVHVIIHYSDGHTLPCDSSTTVNALPTATISYEAVRSAPRAWPRRLQTEPNRRQLTAPLRRGLSINATTGQIY